jgi:hypothetical protein
LVRLQIICLTQQAGPHLPFYPLKDRLGDHKAEGANTFESFLARNFAANSPKSCHNWQPHTLGLNAATAGLSVADHAANHLLQTGPQQKTGRSHPAIAALRATVSKI